MYSNVGKVIEKIFIKQPSLLLEDNHTLHQCQHKFMLGQSALTNLLFLGNHIAKNLSKRHLCDIISIDC